MSKTDTFTLFDMFPDMPDPFNDDYVKNEIVWYNAPEELEHIGDGSRVDIRSKPLVGRVDDYLNVQFRIDSSMVVPMFFIDGEIWMSLTPMEIQSAALALYIAEGQVATGGLGMGYFALRAAAKAQVDHVTVFEQDPNVVEVFRQLHSHRPEYEKISIVPGDVRETMKNKSFDFVFMDIYQSMLGESCIPDIELFMDNNDIQQYWFWGVEKLMHSLWDEGLITVGHLPYTVRLFLWYWSQSEGGSLRPTHAPDEEYMQKGLTMMTDYGIM